MPPKGGYKYTYFAYKMQFFFHRLEDFSCRGGIHLDFYTFVLYVYPVYLFDGNIR